MRRSFAWSCMVERSSNFGPLDLDCEAEDSRAEPRLLDKFVSEFRLPSVNRPIKSKTSLRGGEGLRLQGLTNLCIAPEVTDPETRQSIAVSSPACSNRAWPRRRHG